MKKFLIVLFLLILTFLFENCTRKSAVSPANNNPQWVFSEKWDLSQYFDSFSDGLVAINKNNKVYISNGNEVAVFTQEGEFLYKLNLVSENNAQGTFRSVANIAFDSSDNVYVAENIWSYSATGNNKIQKFNSEGQLITEWEIPPSESGTAAQISLLALDNDNNVWVVVWDGSNKFKVFNSDGTLLKEILISRDIVDFVFDKDGNIFSISGGGCFDKYSSTANLLAQFGSYGSDLGECDYPKNIDVLEGTKLIISDYGNGRIQIFNNNGEFITSLGKKGYDDGEFYYLSDIAVDNLSNIYALDSASSRLQIFKKVGN